MENNLLQITVHCFVGGPCHAIGARGFCMCGYHARKQKIKQKTLDEK